MPGTRLVDYPVVDTETHVFVRCWPIETSPHMSAVDPFTRTEHSGLLLVAEMDRAGVDMAILIGYDGYDFPQFMRRFGSLPGDFMGGRGYTRGWANRYPDRLKYVTTLTDPRAPGLASDYPDVPIQLNHGANANPFGDEFGVLSAVERASENVLVSTSVLGGAMMEWEDGWLYPFRGYLRKLERYAAAIPAKRLAWATDWPWFEGTLKYPQLLQSIVDHTGFLSDSEKQGYPGGNALRH